MIPHGQIQTKKVQRIAIKDEWYESINGYGNTIYFTDGTKGELYGCQDKERTVKAGDSITFKTSKSRFDDKPYIIIVSSSASTDDTQGISQQSNNNTANENTDDEGIHSSVVKEFKLKNYASSQSYYSHYILFEDGIQGELSRCTEKKPLWLKKGASLTFSLRHGKKADMPFIVLPDTAPNESTATSKFRKNDNMNEHQQKSSKWGSRLDDNPLFWIMRQKCISMTTCLDRANELVISGVIDNDKRYELALQDFNFIIEYAEMNNAGALELKEEFKKCNVPFKTKGKKNKSDKNPELFDKEKEK